MTLKSTILACLCTAMLMGCASTANDKNTHAATAENTTSDSNIENSTTEGSENNVQNAANTAQSIIPESCRTAVNNFIRKSDGSLEVLTNDGILRSIDNTGAVKVISKLNDNAANYQLLPTLNVHLHYHPDRIMLENTAGQELFKLAGDPTKRQAYYSIDAAELAILNTNGKFNVWNAEKGFGNIAMNERVQDFINRQSPDHQLGFPGDVRSLCIGKNGYIAVAMDTPSDGKVGLLYLLDSVNAPGQLKNMGRTNTPVKKVMVSATAEYLAAIDEPGQLYFTSTSNKGFVIFAQPYKDVKDLAMSGNNPIIVRPDKVMALDYRTGIALYEIPGNYDKCDVSAEKLYCAGNGIISVFNANDGKHIRSLGFKNDTYTTLENDVISGSCQ
jgi:hypothetical protein